MISYHSTRGDKKIYTFSETILKGIAGDGGLFVPERLPHFSLKKLKPLLNGSYQDTCLSVCDLFKTDFDHDLLKKLIYRAYSDNFDDTRITPLIKLRDNQYLLELWHGPTLAFKDIALQFTTHLFTESQKKEKIHRLKKGLRQPNYLIVVATSGDTGKAALEGYANKEGISIVVFYPYKGVSSLQELSMITQKGKNVAVYGIQGNFDDVQKSVKELFNDKEFNEKLLLEKNVLLSSANSINWGRLFPQIVYHVKSYLDLVNEKRISFGERIDIAVPTGNFGNILAAYYAKIMGLPVGRLICANNENNVYSEFLKTGVYDIRKRKLVKTPSPAMSILVGSNLERLLYELTYDVEKVNFWMSQLKNNNFFKVDSETLRRLKENFFADWVSNKDCLATIKKTYNETNYLLDPHTAVAQAVAERYQNKYGSPKPVVICSTAHWAKFAKDVYKALSGFGSKEDEFKILKKITILFPSITIPPNIANLKNKKIRFKRKYASGKESVERAIMQSLKRW